MAKKSKPEMPDGKPEEASPPSPAKTVFDVFGSDLPDEAFAEIFDQPRDRGWREVDLE